MGWFDNEKDEKTRTSEPVRPTPAAPAPAPTSRGGEGSTLGERLHVNGTIVCEESLRILGKIEGKIQARQELTVAKGADVRAVIQGRRVVVEGSVQGDILASEVVLLGPTASLVGNISTPALHIQEGAFFKGSVEMRSAEPAKSASAGADQTGPKAESQKGAASRGQASQAKPTQPKPAQAKPAESGAGSSGSRESKEQKAREESTAAAKAGAASGRQGS